MLAWICFIFFGCNILVWRCFKCVYYLCKYVCEKIFYPLVVWRRYQCTNIFVFAYHLPVERTAVKKAGFLRIPPDQRLPRQYNVAPSSFVVNLEEKIITLHYKAALVCLLENLCFLLGTCLLPVVPITAEWDLKNKGKMSSS